MGTLLTKLAGRSPPVYFQSDPYKRDLPDVEFHLIDTGHFALEDKADEIVPLAIHGQPLERQLQRPGILSGISCCEIDGVPSDMVFFESRRKG